MNIFMYLRISTKSSSSEECTVLFVCLLCFAKHCDRYCGSFLVISKLAHRLSSLPFGLQFLFGCLSRGGISEYYRMAAQFVNTVE